MRPSNPIRLLPLWLMLSSFYGINCEMRGLSPWDVQELLDAHNYFRGIVYPPATNMLKMAWSGDLAAVAQTYAERCIFGHNHQRSNHSIQFHYVGENIAVTNNPAVQLHDLVHGWYNESLYYNPFSKECTEKECRHYTQVVWASSAWVGCGIQKCDKTTGFHHPSSTILVCNYGPGGNIAGESPYVSGAVPCSWCPDYSPYCQDNLCVDKTVDSSELSDSSRSVLLKNADLYTP